MIKKLLLCQVVFEFKLAILSGKITIKNKISVEHACEYTPVCESPTTIMPQVIILNHAVSMKKILQAGAREIGLGLENSGSFGNRNIKPGSNIVSTGLFLTLDLASTRAGLCVILKNIPVRKPCLVYPQGP